MDKFIIFKLKDVTPAGASLSDDGTGIEIISLPVKSISYMTASTGKVNIFYNDVYFVQKLFFKFLCETEIFLNYI